MKDPKKFIVKIDPFQLFTHLEREKLLRGILQKEKEVCLVHMPPESGLLGKPKVALGYKYTKEAADKGHCKL